MCLVTRHSLFVLRLAKTFQIPKTRSCCLSWKNYKYPAVTYHLRYQLILALLRLRIIVVLTVFNLSNRVLTDIEIKNLDKGLDFAPIYRKINKPELRQDFAEFCRRMRTKWFFRNETTV